MKNKIIGFLFACVIITMCLPTAYAAEVITSGKCGENVLWTLDDEGTLTISGTGAMYSWDSMGQVPWFFDRENVRKLVINNGVTSIGNLAFVDCNNITGMVVIPDSVTSIGVSAFVGCGNIEGFNLSNNLRSVGRSAFGCKKITDITIPDSVVQIDDWAFAGCRGLTSISIGKGLTSIGDYVFNNCDNLQNVTYNANGETLEQNIFSIFKDVPLETVTLGTNVQIIPNHAFSSCRKLKAINIPNSVTSIGDGAFSDCESLSDIIIPNSVTSIGNSAFTECESLTNITIPNSVTSIGRSICSRCTNLANITLPTNLSKISSNMFYGCSSLKNITIPETVTNIEEYAFSGCSSLARIEIPDGVTNVGSGAFARCSALANITIPSKINKIEDELFYDCTGLTNIIIPENIIDIGDYAFDECENLSNITISKNVTNIGHCAFRDCVRLKSITIPDKVVNIGVNAFTSCTGLTNIIIPRNVESIGETAFADCGNLSITVDSGNRYYSDIDGVLYNKDKTEIIAYAKDKLQPNYAIPEGVTKIGNEAFACCVNEKGYAGNTYSNMKNITIPSSIKIIGEYAFVNCKYITSIMLPKEIESIGSLYRSGITDIYYGGSEMEWNNVDKDEYDNSYENITVHYNAIGTAAPVLTNLNVVTNTVGSSLKVALADTEYDSTMITVFYKDGQVVETEITPITAGTDTENITVPDGVAADTAKVFIWSSLESMKPLCEAKSIGL